MRKASLGTIFFTVFLDLLGFGLVVPYLPGVARDRGASALTATLLGAAYSAMQFVFVPLWGRLSDRVGRRPTLLVSILASAIGMFALGTVTSLEGLFVARAFLGFATANIAVASAYIADVTKPEERARGMGTIGAAIGLGFVLGPVIGGLLEAHSPMRQVGALPAYGASALSALNFLLAVFFLPESLAAKHRDGGEIRPCALLVDRFKRMFAATGLRTAIVVHFVVVFSFSGMEQTFRLFTVDMFGLRTDQTGYLLGIVGVVLIGVQGGLMKRLSGAFSEVMLVRTGLVLEAIGFVGVAMSPVLFGGSVGLLALGLATVALGSGLVNPSLSAHVSRLGGAEGQGALLGTLQSAGALSRVFGPIASGAVYQSVGPRAPYGTAALGMVVAFGVALFLKTKPSESP